MASNNETHAEIVREMRGPYYKMGRSNASLDKQMMDYMSFIANRIEAAHKREIAELRAKLKVAEEALVKLQDRLVSSVYDGTIDPHESLKIAEDAIASISEEGGVK